MKKGKSNEALFKVFLEAIYIVATFYAIARSEKRNTRKRS